MRKEQNLNVRVEENFSKERKTFELSLVEHSRVKRKFNNLVSSSNIRRENLIECSELFNDDENFTCLESMPATFDEIPKESLKVFRDGDSMLGLEELNGKLLCQLCRR